MQWLIAHLVQLSWSLAADGFRSITVERGNAWSDCQNALDTTHEITKLIKFSPKRDSIFCGLKAEHDALHEHCSAGTSVLCPTRWTARADSLHSIINNYSTLLDTWEAALEVARDTESRARSKACSNGNI